MLKIPIQFILTLLGVIFLTACDPKAYSILKIKNNVKSAVEVEFYQDSLQVEHFTLAPAQVYEITSAVKGSAGLMPEWMSDSMVIHFDTLKKTDINCNRVVEDSLLQKRCASDKLNFYREAEKTRQQTTKYHFIYEYFISEKDSAEAR